MTGPDVSAWGELVQHRRTVNGEPNTIVIEVQPTGLTTEARDQNERAMMEVVDGWLEEHGRTRGIMLRRAAGWPTPCFILHR